MSFFFVTGYKLSVVGTLFNELESYITDDNGQFLKNLTHEQLEMHGCVLSTAATDALMLKHQTVSIHSVD